MDTDAISSPYRPLVQGIISRRNVLLVSLTGLFGGWLVLVLLHPLGLFFTLLSVIGLATYTYFKRQWWGGPFYNAWIVALLPIIGKLTAEQTSRSFSLSFENRVFPFIMLSIFFSYANFVLMGYFKDISADRASGYNTLVVAFGWEKAAIVSDIFASLSLLFSGWAVSTAFVNETLSLSSLISVILFFVALVFIIFAQVGIHQTRDEKEAYRPITQVVRGFILLHLAEISSLRPEWLPFIVIFYIGFELVLKRRPEKKQV